MTEKSDTLGRVELTPVMERFVLHWGEMGARWGVNRTVAQIHALLYVARTPLNAEQIAGTLSVARSNVSTSIKELQAWGIIRVVHVLGDRRDHFEPLTDVWQMFQIIMDERKRREIDPTLALLRDCVVELEATKPADPHVLRRLTDLRDFFETTSTWYGHVRHLPRDLLLRFLKLGRRIPGWLRPGSE